jgi:hypothetical protein
MRTKSRALSATDLDRRISIWRSMPVDDGTATVPGEPSEIGKRSAKRSDISDGERFRAGELGQKLTTRWTVRSDALTRTIAGGDIIMHRGVTYDVVGTKEIPGRFVAIEITTGSRPDARP